MPVTQLEDIIEFGADVLGTIQTDQGTVMAQTGDVVGSFVNSNDVEVWGPPGYSSRPAKARTGKDAAQAITLNRGSNDVIVAFRDIRASSLQGTLGPGETVVYAPGPDNAGVCKVWLQNDGSNRKVTITVGDTKIEVQSDGTINVSGSKVNLAGASDFVALSQKVDSNFQNLAASLNSGQDSLNKPIVFAPPFTPSSTAAADTKAS